MTHLKRNRKSFTLLELMIAFVIMAILSAVAIPSLISVAASDRSTADAATAIAAQDAAYFDAVANAQGAVTSVTYPTFGGVGSGHWTASTTGGVTTYHFSDGDVCVSAPNTGGDSPTVTSCTPTTTTTVATTTTTAPSVFEDIATCSISVVGTLGADPANPYDSNNYTLTCSGVTGPEVDATFLANGTYFSVTVWSTASNDEISGPYDALPPSFTTTYAGGGSSGGYTDGAETDYALEVYGTSLPSGAPPAGDVGLYDSSYNQLSCYTAGCGTIAPTGVTAADAPPALALATYSYPSTAMPLGLASNGTDIWTANTDLSTITEFSVATDSVVRNITPTGGDAPVGVTVCGGNVWAAERDGNVTEIDASSGAILNDVFIGGAGAGITCTPGDVWVSSLTTNSVTELDASTGAVVHTVSLPGVPGDAGDNGSPTITTDGTTVWVTSNAPGDIQVIDAATATITGTISGSFSHELSYSGGYLWTTSNGNIVKIDASTNAVVYTSVHLALTSVVYSDGTDLWYVIPGNLVVEMNASTYATVSVTPTISGTSISQLISAGGKIWATNYAYPGTGNLFEFTP